MKKMLFLAAIGVAGLVSAKPNSAAIEVSMPEKAFQLCGVMVTYYDSLGSPTGQTWFTSDQPTLSDCQSYQRGVISDLTAQGYKVKAQLSASVE